MSSAELSKSDTLLVSDSNEEVLAWWEERKVKLLREHASVPESQVIEEDLCRKNPIYKNMEAKQPYKATVFNHLEPEKEPKVIEKVIAQKDHNS